VKIYIAGPMTGYPQLNYSAFREAKQQLEAAGYKVVLPHLFGDDHSEEHEMMIEELQFIYDEAEALYFLRGFERSTGCMVEWWWAKKWNKKVLYQNEI